MSPPEGHATYPDLLALGLTYRQINYWAKRDWLRADDVRPGSGRARTYPASELEVAATMRRLTAAGVTPEAAHRAARSDGWLSAEVRVLLVEPSEVAA